MTDTGSNPGSSRGHRGLFPPNPRIWKHEREGLLLREQLAVEAQEPLPVARAFTLLGNAEVLPFSAIPVAQRDLAHLRRMDSKTVSALTLLLDDGASALVLYNDAHPETRIRATLMEEFFHIRLGHPPTLIRVHDGSGRRRTRDNKVEEEAYGCGAAALLPYSPLRDLLKRGTPAEAIARQFNVSPGLVRFRANVTRVFRPRHGAARPLA